MMRRCAVVGNPIAHSLSPTIHRMFASQVGIELQYDAILSPLDGVVGTLNSFFASGGLGVNVTVPFKEVAFGWVSSRDAYAGAAGAVNTIVATNGIHRGYNTDGIGLINDLTTNLGCSLSGKRLLVLGAGGAVRGIVGPLLGSSPSCVVIANRTVARARELIERFEDPRLVAANLERPGEAFDVVINGTSAGLTGELPNMDGSALRGSLVYDMVYGANARVFCAWAIQMGVARVVDGLGMLVEQAAEAFRLFHGMRPDGAVVLRTLRARSV